MMCSEILERIKIAADLRKILEEGAGGDWVKNISFCFTIAKAIRHVKNGSWLLTMS